VCALIDVGFALSDIRKNCTNADNLLLAAKRAIASVVSTFWAVTAPPQADTIAYLKSRLAKARRLLTQPMPESRSIDSNAENVVILTQAISSTLIRGFVINRYHLVVKTTASIAKLAVAV